MGYHLTFRRDGRLKGVCLDLNEAAAASRASGKPSLFQTVPGDWAMFTPAGNRSLRLKAERFVRDLAGPESTAEEAARRFFRSYRGMCDYASLSEAGDTAVRECVWEFATRFADLFPGGREQLDRLWEER